MTRADFLLPARPLSTLGREAAAEFARRFARPPAVLAAAPGRVNLIGEHTDYNGGHVLPLAIDRYALVAAAPAQQHTGRVRLESTDFAERAEFTLTEPLAPTPPAWSNYLRGVIEACRQRGMPIAGMDVLLFSSVPAGGGLSSSAAIEVAMATALEQLAGKSLEPVDKALACQWAEHRFAGTPCGIMDQFASVLCQDNSLLLLDCRSQLITHVPWPTGDVSILIINSNVKHDLASGEYARRREECRQAADAIGADDLCLLEPAAVERARGKLSAVQWKRARHASSENRRTLQAADAIGRGDWALVGQLMDESHVSLRDDYEVSCPEVDLLVALSGSLRSEGVFGARITGGGFGGCAVMLVRTGALEHVARHICDAYQRQTGIVPSAFATRPSGGAQAVPLP